MVPFTEHPPPSAKAITKSFAPEVSNVETVVSTPLPTSEIKGDSLCIKITQQVYDQALLECQKKLHERLVLSKGDKPFTAKEITLKLTEIWKTTHPWRLVSFDIGFFGFIFGSIEDMRLVWAHGTLNLKPGLL
jgi:hypothetical protein